MRREREREGERNEREGLGEGTLYCFLSSFERGALMIARRSLLGAEK